MIDALAAIVPAAASTTAAAAGSTAVSATASSAPASIPLWIELLVVMVSAGTGVLTAREHKLDFVGALWLAVILGLGGGLIRDVILQVGNVYILNQPLALPLALLSATVVFIFPAIVEKPDKLINLLDIFSVGLYACLGCDKAYVYGFEPTVCIMMGFFTAVGGGMLRDICLARTPIIFQKGNFYALAAIGGAAIYIWLVRWIGVWNILALIIGTAVTMGLRWISIKFNIQTPTQVDISRMVPHRHRRGAEGASSALRQETPVVGSVDALAGRRERTLADIEERRERERRAQALARLRKNKRKRKQRRLDM